MDDSILFTILIPVIIVLLFILLNRSKEQKNLLETLFRKINKLNDDVYRLSEQLKEKSPSQEQAQREQESIAVKPETAAPEEKIIIPEIAAATKPVLTTVEEQENVVPETTSTHYEYPSATRGKSSPKEAADIEKFIGENIANKIGIAVLVLGIAFFIKYAIDKDWIKEAGRVITGMISGCILIGIAHRYHRQYRSFSSVLVGGGLSVFYFSIAFAFHQYHLISQLQAFMGMVLVSAFAVWLSVYYNRLELAVLATIGGFITPFLVSTGQSNHVVLFTYLCILNAALTALSWFKRWPAINVLALVFTTFIYGGWLLFYPGESDFPAGDALLFATLFYLLFIGMNVVNTVRMKLKFTAFYFIILLSIHVLYYGAGIFILSYRYGITEKGVFTLCLGIFLLLLTAIFYRRKDTDRNFVLLLMGLSLTFITLTVPVWLRGNHITLCWMAEAVLLYYLFRRSGIRLLLLSSGILTIIMLFSLMETWLSVYSNGTGTLIAVLFNKGYTTGLVVFGGLFLYSRLVKGNDDGEFIYTITQKGAQSALLILAVIILYISGTLEIYYQFNTRLPDVPVYAVYEQLYSFIFIIVLEATLRKKQHLLLIKLCLTAFSLLLYGWYLNGVSTSSVAALNGTISKTLFWPHWLSVLILAWIIYDAVRSFMRNSMHGWKEYSSVLTWITAIACVTILSNELYHVLKWISYTDEKDWAWWRNLYAKAGLSICWGLCSFVLMWLGMRHHFRTLRIISLTLFTITLVKLFLADIRNIPPGGKIAAFILLGILLLVVSFMYQRLKRIIIDEKTAENKHDSNSV